MDVNQSRNNRNAGDDPIDKDKEAPSDDDAEHKKEAPSEDDDTDYDPNNDLQPSPSDDNDNHLVTAAAADGKFYVRGMEIDSLDDADEGTREHVKAFYDEAIPLLRSAGKNWRLMLKEKHDTILSAFIRFRDGERAANLCGEFPQCYKWFLAYAIVNGIAAIT
jgi:hypothetical protein